MYTPFILDAFHHEIVGWQVTHIMREASARDALKAALAAKYRAGEDLSGLVHQSNRGVQFPSFNYGENLAMSEVVELVGSRGGSYDEMAATLNSVDKGRVDRPEIVVRVVRSDC